MEEVIQDPTYYYSRVINKPLKQYILFVWGKKMKFYFWFTLMY